ncbi:unnamed protein product [Caenorhabditis nigoni]
MSSNMSYNWKMTLFYVLTNKFEPYPEAYECPQNSAKPGAQWPTFGIYLLVSGSIFLCLYLPCFIAILKIKSSAPTYQLMSLIAVFDITGLINGSLINGYITYHGIFFCQYPVFFFITGSLGLFSWLSSCIVCIFLAIERVSEIDPDFALSFLFEKKVFRLVKWCLILYTSSSLLFGKSIIFSAAYGIYLYDPLIGKHPELYTNNWVNGNNFVMAISTTTLYIYLCYILFKFKYRYSTSMWLYKSKRQITLQVILLCFFHSANALIYAYLYFVLAHTELIIAEYVMWQISYGSLSIVYLTLNRTIRNAVLKMVIPKHIRAKFGWHIRVEEHQAVESVMDVKASLL